MELTPSPLDALIPIIVALLKQSGFPAKYNAIIAIASYFAWTAISLWLGIRVVDGPVTPEVFIGCFVAAATTGFVSYNLFWSHFGEQALEDKTSIVKGPSTDPIEDDEAHEGENGGNG